MLDGSFSRDLVTVLWRFLRVLHPVKRCLQMSDVSKKYINRPRSNIHSFLPIFVEVIRRDQITVSKEAAAFFLIYFEIKEAPITSFPLAGARKPFTKDITAGLSQPTNGLILTYNLIC